MKAEILCKNARKTAIFGILTKALVEEFFRKTEVQVHRKKEKHLKISRFCSFPDGERKGSIKKQ